MKYRAICSSLLILLKLSCFGQSNAAGILYTASAVCVPPTTITGNLAICVPASITNATTALTSNGTTGGTWSSVTTSHATVNSATGVVTGVAVGTSVISYTNSCGTATAIVSVAASPSPIRGSPNTTVGSSVVLSSSAGGAWSSSNTAIATVNSSGRTFGASTGTCTISYILTGPGSCGTDIIFTVMAMPFFSILILIGIFFNNKNQT